MMYNYYWRTFGTLIEFLGIGVIGCGVGSYIGSGNNLYKIMLPIGSILLLAGAKFHKIG